MNKSVLIVTGGLITENEDSLVHALVKLSHQLRRAKDVWLDLKVKTVAAETLVGLSIEKMMAPLWRRARRPRSAQSVATDSAPIPSLTEVLLMTLLHERGVPFQVMTLDMLFSRRDHAARLLAESDCLFLSTTYLHDLSELQSVLDRFEGSGKRIVVGGALVGVIHGQWEGEPGIDVVAVGHGEMLVDPLVDWLRSDFSLIKPPASGRLQQKQHSQFLYSGVPDSLNLDGLPRPDWQLAQAVHGRPFPTMFYESVRGCPYRCAFCNYPFLFDDHRFRTKSAEKIADDWERYVSDLGVTHIICLDSLFTMPRQRLQRLCVLMIERRIDVKWICYARADDLADEETVAMMVEAGAHQVQVGIESGDPQILANMAKSCTVSENRQALLNCRKYGLTSVVSLIVGYPGETAETLARTYDFLLSAPPDFYYLATFSTRIAGVPVLQPEMKARFGLATNSSLHSMAPYWVHDTMTCLEAANHVRALDKALIRNRVALNGLTFYPDMLTFRQEDRDDLLDLQKRVALRPWLSPLFNSINYVIDRRLARAVDESLAPRPNHA